MNMQSAWGPVRAHTLPPDVSPDETPRVTLGHRFLSSRPVVVDDFSGSGVMSLLRMLARVRNLDGPDDIASGVPTAMSKAQAPYVEMGLLAAFFPLVAAAAVGAVKSARAGYAQDYPDSVRRTLDQQQRLIDALKHGNRFGAGESEAVLQPLIHLHAQGVERFETRQRHREKGLIALLKHNLIGKQRHLPGNGALSDAFNKQAADIIAGRFARNWRLDTEETTYQSHRAQRCEDERRAAKRARTVKLLTGVALPGMTAGVVASAGKSAASVGVNAAQAAGNLSAQAAAQAAHQTLGAVTGGLMMGAQLAQCTAGVLSFRGHVAQRRQICQDREALRAIAPRLPERVPLLLAQDTRSAQADNGRSQACDLLLSSGQALMLGAGVATLACPPLAPAMLVPGIGLTLAGSIGAAFNEAHRENHLGETTAEPLKTQMRLGDLGPRLRDRPLGHVLREVADRFEAHQDLVPLTRLWSNVLKVLKQERRGWLRRKSSAGAERYRRLVTRNEKRRAASPLLEAGRDRLRALREERYPQAWFDAPASVLQERLAADMRQHPDYAAVTGLKTFQQEVFFATARALARRSDPAAQALFHDRHGRRLNTLRADERFLRFLAEDTEARVLHVRKHNEILARHLRPVDRFGRADCRDALTDLAHVQVDRAARHGPAPTVQREIVRAVQEARPAPSDR